MITSFSEKIYNTRVAHNLTNFLVSKFENFWTYSLGYTNFLILLSTDFRNCTECFLVDLIIASWCRSHATSANYDVACDRGEYEHQIPQVGSVEIEVPNEVK
jgi:hypothetical protein